MTGKKFAIVGMVVALLMGTAALKADDAPKKSGPLKEHEWLQQFVGEWESETPGEPGKPPQKGKITESARTLGKLWIVSESNIETTDKPITGMLTLGYDSQKKKYVATWIDSMTSYLWKYEGAVDAEGKTLTLEADGPNPIAAGKLSKFKDVHEFKSKDNRVLTSSMLGADGKWHIFATVNYRRKK